MVLDGASPTARRNGPVAVLPLYEAAAGDYANLQMAAVLEYLETAWLRRLELGGPGSMTSPRLDAGTVQARLRLMRDPLDDLAFAGDVTGERLRRDRLLVHEYTEIDIDRVAAAVPGAIDAMGAYVSEVASWLGDQPDR